MAEDGGRFGFVDDQPADPGREQVTGAGWDGGQVQQADQRAVLAVLAVLAVSACGAGPVQGGLDGRDGNFRRDDENIGAAGPGPS